MDMKEPQHTKKSHEATWRVKPYIACTIRSEEIVLGVLQGQRTFVCPEKAFWERGILLGSEHNEI